MAIERQNQDLNTGMSGFNDYALPYVLQYLARTLIPKGHSFQEMWYRKRKVVKSVEVKHWPG